MHTGQLPDNSFNTNCDSCIYNISLKRGVINILTLTLPNKQPYTKLHPNGNLEFGK